MARSILIGVDGADWSAVRPLLDAGELPALASLPHRGDLASSVPPLSPVAWASVYTGARPERHGIYGFFYRPEPATSYRRELVDRHRWRVPAVWERLAQRELTFGGYNLPCVGAPDPVDGWMVCGLCATGDDFAWPRGLQAELRKRGHVLDAGEPDDLSTFRVHLDKLETAARLADAVDVDALWLVFEFPDRLGHFAWPDVAARRGEAWALWRELWAATDGFVAWLLARWPDAHLAVVSDHGFGACEYLDVNVMLRDAGLLSFRRDPAGWPEDALLLDEVDWPRTAVHSLNPFGGLRLNLRGRDPQGAVDPGDAEALRRELADLLGLPVLSRESVYGRWPANPGDAPDFVAALPEGTAFYVSGRGHEFRGLARRYAGDHRPTGLWLSNREWRDVRPDGRRVEGMAGWMMGEMENEHDE